jgi:hypothetical protein
MKTSLDYKKDFLCVLAEFEVADASQEGVLVKKWYPVNPANEAEARALVGHPVIATDSGKGIYGDEEGNVYQLANGAETRPLEIERVASKPDGNLAALLQGSLRKAEQPRQAHGWGGPVAEGNNHEKVTKGRKRKGAPTVRQTLPNGDAPISVGIESESARDTQDSKNSPQLNLRQKLALVRRRLGYVQKRGHNELHNYSYVTAADLAGAVGDILAELGVLVVPRLESISHEPARSGRANGEHLTHVVMNYSFVDVDTAEDITVKVAGEGVDAGDKAPYKAMTGALKYALLQSFLLATGDDPEDERVNPVDHSATSRARNSEQVITGENLCELRQLIEDTGTELERVLTYYKLSSLDEMTEGTYRRAVELLKRKKAKQNSGESTHAQN